MKKNKNVLFILVACISLLLILVVIGTGNVPLPEPEPDDRWSTFSCEPGSSDLQLMCGDCENPLVWVHVYDLGEVRRLVRITGTAEQRRGGATGEGPIRFFMTPELPCIWSDIWWIRVTAVYNTLVSFDKYVDPDLPDQQEHKLWGRYLLIGGSSEAHQMVFSEGTAYWE